jgi:hypothetical protein
MGFPYLTVVSRPLILEGKMRASRVRIIAAAVVLGLVAGLASSLVDAPLAHAAKAKPVLGKGTRTVLRTGLYGALAGTAVGLAALPFDRKARTVFIGTSSGLYLGLAVGLFLVWEDSEPEDYEVSQLSRLGAESVSPPRQQARTPPLFYTRMTVLRF